MTKNNKLSGNGREINIKYTMENLDKVTRLRGFVKKSHIEEDLFIPKSAMIDRSVNRMLMFHKRSHQKIEEIRQQKLTDELGAVHSPQINNLSRKYSANVVPIHKRVDALIKRRNENLKNLQLEFEMKRRSEEDSNCTFVPKTNQHSTKNDLSFSEKAQIWLDQSKQAKQKLEEDKRIKDQESLQHKPTINSKSRRIADKRSTSPITDRLYNPHPHNSEHSSSPFRPVLNNRSMLLAKEKNSGNVFERLYATRKEANLNQVKYTPRMEEILNEVI